MGMQQIERYKKQVLCPYWLVFSIFVVENHNQIKYETDILSCRIHFDAFCQ